MGLEFDFNISGIDGQLAYIREIKERARSMQKLSRRIATLLRACFASNFNNEGRPDPWQPLEPSTIADKNRQFENGEIRGRRAGIRVRLGPDGAPRGQTPGILIRSGALKDSIARAHSKGNIEKFRDNGRQVIVGTNVPYAAVHEFGGMGSYSIMPKTKGVLRWWGIDRKTGKEGWIFARSVRNHPPMPKRSFLVVTDETWAAINDETRQYLMGEDYGKDSGS